MYIPENTKSLGKYGTKMLLLDTNRLKNIETCYEVVYSIIKDYCNDVGLKSINCENVSIEINKALKDVMTLQELYVYIADYCVTKSSYHPEYKKLASVITVDELNSRTMEDYKIVVSQLYNNIDKNGNSAPLVSKKLHDIVMEHNEEIQKELNFDKDYGFDYFGIKTLERSYLYKLLYEKNIDGVIVETNRIVERPQHMFMRVALGIHGSNLVRVFETYKLLSDRFIVHATPTLFNAGSTRPQMSSCFLLHMSDSIEGIFDTVSDIAKISKWAGGIGFSLTNIRAKGSIIRKTNGVSDGIVPLCQLLTWEGKYVNQGGKRNGSIAVYIEPWHADIYDFCELRRNNGKESAKARDLFLGLWVPDLFMKRVKQGGMWSLMCPDECPGLATSHGEKFEKLYMQYEQEHRYKKQVRAVDLWYHILSCQIETGMPYMLFKDHVNHKSNQQNLGTIQCSNLCTEILEFTDENTTAVCNLASICLPRLINNNNKVFDFEKLISVTRVLVRNLDIIIDENFYPTEKTKNSNSKHRPIGIGIQGLADLYNLMSYPFDSEEARLLNKQIFETIYYAALCESNELAIKYGQYESFPGSPTSEGKLQFHLWGLDYEKDLLMGYDWGTLIESIKKHGLRNSLLTTCMPTASTAQIMGNSESIEPYLTNIFTRSTLAGEFIVINENLLNDLIRENLWNDSVRKKIIVFNGSIQNISEIPDKIKKIYKTAFELKLKEIVSQSCDRAPFIDQSQSLNLFMEKSDFDVLTSAHFYSWEHGLKTGMYYLRTRPAVDPTQFGIEASEIQKIKNDLINTNMNKDNEEKICKWRPGVKISDCSSCT